MSFSVFQTGLYWVLGVEVHIYIYIGGYCFFPIHVAFPRIHEALLDLGLALLKLRKRVDY